MTSLTTFYLSGITGKEVFGSDGDVIGVIRDLMVNAVPSGQNDPNQQMITGIKLKIGKETKLYSFTTFRVVKVRENISVTCYDLIELSSEEISKGCFWLKIFRTSRLLTLMAESLYVSTM